MDCPKCGKSMGTFGNQFWCPKCRAYYCYACVKNKLVCPKCGGRISGDKTSIMPISFLMVIVMLLGIGLLTSSVFNNAYVYTKIANLHQGDHVRIFGEINSTDTIVATVIWVNDDWQLQNYTSFGLVDTGDPGSVISINLSQCKYFNLGEAPQSGQDIYEYQPGDRVTVLGRVTADISGNLSLNATSMYPGRISNESGFPASILLFIGASVIITVLLTFFQLNRRSLHRRFLEQNPVFRMPKLPFDETLPEGLTGWMENPLLQKRLYWNRVLLHIAVFAGIPLVIIGLYFIGTSFVMGIIVMFIGIYMMIMSGVFYYLAYNTPSRIALAGDGLHMQYAKPRNPASARTFIAWNDVTGVQPQMREKDEGIRIELNDGFTVLWASRDIQDAVLEAFRSRDPSRTEAGKPASMARHAVGVHQTKETPPAENWDVLEAVRNRTPDRTAVMGGIMIAAGILGASAYFLVNQKNMDGSRWMNLALILMMFSVNGLLLLAFRYLALDTVAFSKSGITLKFLGSRQTVPPIPWNAVFRVPPSGLGWFFIQLSSGEKFQLRMTEQRIGRKIIEWLDRNYMENHPGIQGGGPGESLIEKFDNGASVAARKVLNALIAAIFAGFALGAISFILFYAGDRAQNPYPLVGTMLSAMLIGIFLPISGQNYKLWKNAPRTVGFSRAGLMADYRNRPPPVGHAGFVAWDEIAGIESLPQAVGSIQLTWDLRDTDRRKTVVIRKRSGTAHILGPVDPAIADALKRRIIKNE